MPHSHHELPESILKFMSKFNNNDLTILQTLHELGENKWGTNLKNWIPAVLDIWHTAFSELHITSERTYSAINDNELLEYVVFGSITGVHTGPLQITGDGFDPLPASGLRVKIDMSAIFTVKDDLIYRYFPQINWFAMLAETNLLKFVVNEKNQILDYIVSIERAGHFKK